MLQEESELKEIVQLVGMDALSAPTTSLTLEVARMHAGGLPAAERLPWTWTPTPRCDKQY